MKSSAHSGRRSVTQAFLLAFALLACSPVFADESAATTAAHIAKKLDPSDFRSRFEIRDRLQEPQTGGLRNTLVPRMEFAFSKQLVVRIETPVMVFDADRPGFATQGGMGDLLVRANVRLFRTAHTALVAGYEFTFDTASEKFLGTGHHAGGPLMFLSIDEPRLHTTFFPFIQHMQSFAGDPSRKEVNYTMTRMFALTRWPERFYSATELSIYFDHVRNKEGATLELEGGRFINSHVALWARPGFGNWGDNLPQVYNWNIEFGMRYLFD